ncbi:lipopolysaccharide biosynthesis protein [Corallincola spongiicola]|uniref:Lipopolysaccharide biosynthesis protein n=1 Tax=Corallincola spongiicola TaxID=2520508 RepID=A0ABY1WQ98_9GAMM|nr:lipopolysaccharide biosynthesis protein [Corallincola spongiicola]TAA46798.1 lipopolysaccharide biosynthesis protein [Corallincola spongiicola]
MKRLLQNTFSNVGVLFIKLAITFVMTPVIVYNLGNYDYGIWEIIGSVLGYMGMLDLGLKPTISRFAARYNAQADRDGMGRVYSTSLVFMLSIGLFLSLVFLIWALFFPESIAAPESDISRYALLLMILGAQLMVIFPGYVAVSFLEGLQHYQVKNNILLINSLIGAACIYWLITPENGIIVLALINAIGTVTKFLLYFWLLSRPNYGQMRFSRANCHWQTLTELMSFGLKSFVQGAATRISNNADNFVIAFFLGPATIIFYALPANLIRHIRMLIMSITHAFLPFFSDLQAREDSASSQRYYVTASRYVVAIALMLTLCTAALGPDFIAVWIDVSYREPARFVLYLLLVTVMVPLFNPLSSRYLTALGEHGILARLAVWSALVSLGLSLSLVHWFGLEGIALASVVPTVFIQWRVLGKTCEQLAMSRMDYLAKVVGPNVLPVVATIAALYTAQLLWVFDSYLVILLVGGVSSVVYLLVLFCCIPATDRQMLRRRKLQGLDQEGR